MLSLVCYIESFNLLPTNFFDHRSLLSIVIIGQHFKTPLQMTTTTTSPFPSPTAPRRSSTPLTPSQCKHTRLTPIDDCYNFPSFIVIVATSFSFIISGGRWLLRLNKNGGLCHVVMVDHRNGATTTCSPFIVIYLSLFPLDVRLYVSLSLSNGFGPRYEHRSRD